VNIAALENQSIVQPDIGARRSSWCFLQLFKIYPVNPRTDEGAKVADLDALL
jgi:hypothetical protein